MELDPFATCMFTFSNLQQGESRQKEPGIVMLINRNRYRKSINIILISTDSHQSHRKIIYQLLLIKKIDFKQSTVISSHR